MRHTTSARYTRWARLTTLRCRAQLNKRDLAARLHVSYVHICQLEQGRVRASDELTFDIARLFDEDAADLCASRPPVPPRGSDKRPRAEVA